MVEEMNKNIDNGCELDYKEGYLAMISAIEEQYKPLQLAAEMGVNVVWIYQHLEAIMQAGEDACCGFTDRKAARY